MIQVAVIPVAGLGTRFLPVTKAVPKEMLPIVDRPCIEYVVAEAVEAGLSRIVFVTARGKDALVDYFDRSPTLEQHLLDTGKADVLAELRRITRMAEVVAVRQQEALGLGHAVLTALPAVGEQDFAVLLGDDIMDSRTPASGQLLQAHAEVGGAVVGLFEVPREHTNRYGICAGPWVQPGRMQVAAMVEKPSPETAPSNQAIVGRYVLPGEIFEILAHTPRGKGGEVQLTDAIAVLCARGQVHGQVLEGLRHDTGNVLGLLRASLHYARKRPELRAGLDEILAELQRS